MAEAIGLAHAKPDRGFTRDDLLVYGGWLNSGWSWSRDVGVPLERAIDNAKQLEEDVRIVGRGAKLNGKAKKSEKGINQPIGKRKKSKDWSLGSLFSRGPKNRPANKAN